MAAHPGCISLPPSKDFRGLEGQVPLIRGQGHGLTIVYTICVYIVVVTTACSAYGVLPQIYLSVYLCIHQAGIEYYAQSL